MSRRRLLDDETAAQLYADYCQWLEACAKWHPKKLRAKYGITDQTMRDYVLRRHKRKAA